MGFVRDTKESYGSRKETSDRNRGRSGRSREEKEREEERADIRKEYAKNFARTHTGMKPTVKQFGKWGLQGSSGPMGAAKVLGDVGVKAYKQYNDMANEVKTDLGLGSVKEAKKYMDEKGITPTKMWGQGEESKRRDFDVSSPSTASPNSFSEYVTQQEDQEVAGQETAPDRSQSLLERLGQSPEQQQPVAPGRKMIGLRDQQQPVQRDIRPDYSSILNPINFSIGGNRVDFIPGAQRDWVESQEKMRLDENKRIQDELNANRGFGLQEESLQNTIAENRRNYQLQQDRNNMLWAQTDEAKRLNDMRDARDKERIAQGGRGLDIQAEANDPSIMDYISGGAGLLGTIGSFF